MKGIEPVICKRFRRLFRNAGYKTYLINEFRTSKLCNCCHKEIEPFMTRLSNKPKDHKIEKKILVNRLLYHKDDKHKCEIIHNRDITESIFYYANVMIVLIPLGGTGQKLHLNIIITLFLSHLSLFDNTTSFSII
jgi:hypothetical protein